MSRSSSRRVGPKAAFNFGVATATGAILGVLAVFLFAITHHPHRAIVLLGSGMIILGLLRAFWPGRPWFSARNRTLDVIVYLLVGVVLLYLSPWTAAEPPPM